MKRWSTRPSVRRMRPLSRAAYLRILRATTIHPPDIGDVYALLGEFERRVDDQTRVRLRIR